MSTPKEIVANRVINTAIRENEIPGWDGAITVEKAHELIRKAIDTDRAERHGKGMQAARRFAGWHIGDGHWAELIIEAYTNPDLANEIMDSEDVPENTDARRYY